MPLGRRWHAGCCSPRSVLALVLIAATVSPLTDSPLVLKGPKGRATVVVHAPKSDSGRLRLSWRSSDLVDKGRSSLTVLWNGRPLRTVRLRKGRLRLPLSGVPSGFHQLELRAHLVVPDDPCILKNPDGGWLRFDEGSSIEWVRPASSTKLLAGEFKTWPRQWTDDSNARVAVALDGLDFSDVVVAQAALELHVFLRKEGFRGTSARSPGRGRSDRSDATCGTRPDSFTRRGDGYRGVGRIDADDYSDSRKRTARRRTWHRGPERPTTLPTNLSTGASSS